MFPHPLRRPRRFLLGAVLLAAFCGDQSNARTWFVDRAVTGRADGRTWQTAFPGPADALRVARTGDEVWCRAGVYELTAALRPLNGITLRGGFVGPETSPLTRDHMLTTHATIFRQTRPGVSVIALHRTRQVTLDGLTLTGANGAPGLHLSACDESVVVRQCQIVLNRSAGSGAGVAVVAGTDATFFACKIADNTTFSAPSGISGDAGIAPERATAANLGGAGLFVDETSRGTWTACVFSGNVAAGATAGAVLLRTGSGRRNLFVGCDFYFNEAGETGSAIDTEGALELRDCIVCSNRARRAGPGAALSIHGPTARVTLDGQTYVVGNVAGGGGATYAAGVDGASLCEVRGAALVANQTGPADPTLWTLRNDVHLAPRDQFMPPLTNEPPGAGKWVRQTLPSRTGTAAYHCLYLPADWQPGRKYPVLVGFPGNGPFRNRYGDRSGGMPEDNEMPYGISGGRGCIVLALGYLDSRHDLAPTGNWWGDVEATVTYCEDAVSFVCRQYGGDPARVVLTGFSRSAVGASFIGLHDDKIAGLWRGFICYDGWEAQRDMARDWYRYGKSSFNYDPADSGGTGVAQRFARVAGRPVFILGGRGEAKELNGNFNFPFTLVDKSHRNHNTSWSMRDTAERAQVRAWLDQVLRNDVTGGPPD